jgi:hypothetical protein
LEVCATASPADAAGIELTIPILRVPRRYDAFIAWIDATNARHAIAENRAQARLGVGPFKVFREEVMPFRPVAERLYAGTNAVIRFFADGGPRDVIVTETSQGTDQLFEITTAGDGHDNRLRMELLSTEGQAPAFGSIEKVGPKKRNYRVVAETEAVEHQSWIGKICHHLVAAIERKKLGQYAPDVWLVVHFDGNLVRESDMPQIVESATQAASTTRFPRVYLAATTSWGRLCQQVR